MLDELKDMYISKSRDVFIIQSNICDGAFCEKPTNDFRKKHCTIYVRLGKYTFEKVGIFKMKLSKGGSTGFEKGWRSMLVTMVG